MRKVDMPADNAAQLMTPAQETRLNAATTWVPLTLVASVVAIVVWGTWSLSSERTQIYARIDQISSQVQSLTTTVGQLADVIGKPNTGAYTRQDFILDCLRSEIANPNWKCIYSGVNVSSVARHGYGFEKEK
jgi:outer membrane murein-binding lipoprotein Lpp